MVFSVGRSVGRSVDLLVKGYSRLPNPFGYYEKYLFPFFILFFLMLTAQDANKINRIALFGKKEPLMLSTVAWSVHSVKKKS